MLGRLLNVFRPGEDRAVYDLLPTSEWGHSSPPPRLARWRTWRRRTWISIVASLSGVAFIFGLPVYVHFHPTIWRTRLLAELFGPKPLPPLYPEFRAAELALPQHHVEDPFANGQKYLWAANHAWWSGWGNFMQDMVMTAHLTYRSGRTYVFDDYTWDKYGPDYSVFDGNRWIPSRIPLSALISGPIAGGNFSHGDPTPRSVAKAYFKKICPRPRIIESADVRKLHGDWATAVQIEDAWLEYLSHIDDPCVEIAEKSYGIFHAFMFGHKDEMLPIWPLLSSSPILQLLGWSTLAHDAFDTNRALFSPAPSTAREDPHALLDGLLALHLRRGDFLEHCENLGHWGADFNAFNRFDDFPDPWIKPEGSDEERMAVYMRRCLPTIEQIVEKVEAVRASPAGSGLKNVYIMTNGDHEWLKNLKHALFASHTWEHVATSRDLTLTWEQKFVSQTMDMLVGERAQVFIGNGFSSMTSNIAMLRQARHIRPDSTHMW